MSRLREPTERIGGAAVRIAIHLVGQQGQNRGTPGEARVTEVAK